MSCHKQNMTVHEYGTNNQDVEAQKWETVREDHIEFSQLKIKIGERFPFSKEA
jgi:hypothetical protein